MRMNTTFSLLALALVAAPLSAQVIVKNDQVRARTAKIPPGQLPPKGMCRVWIDGVPPGQQPAVTDCATAERTRVANSRVIYGDQASFPGRGTGKFKRAVSGGDVARRCTVSDAVVVNGRVVNVCRDDTVIRDRQGRVIRRDKDDEDKLDRRDRDDEDKLEKKDKDEKVKVKANKGDKKGKHGDRDDQGDDHESHENNRGQEG